MNSHFRCPTCYQLVEKGNDILMLMSGASIGGEGVNFGGIDRELHKIKRVMYCSKCRGALDFHALLQGKLDPKDHLWVYLIAAVFSIGTAYVSSLSAWYNATILIGSFIVAFIINDKIEKRRLRVYSLSQAQVEEMKK